MIASRETAGRPTRIAQVGAFDIENLGDLLFPTLAERALAERLGPVEIDPFSYHGRPAAGWPYAVRPLGELIDAIDSYDLLLVGGGDTIRYDKQVLPGYEPADPRLHHPTSLWLVPILLAAANGVPIAWNAPGVVNEPPPWALAPTRAALRASDYVAVRDPISASRLATVDGVTPLVVPDTAFAIRTHAPAEPGDGARALLAELGVDGPWVVLQAARALAPAAARIDAAIGALSERGIATIELPISPVLGDRAGAIDRDLATVSPASWPDPATIVELVAGARAVVATSLHLSIVAAALGVPVSRPELAGRATKYEILRPLAGVHHWTLDASDGQPIPIPIPLDPVPAVERPAELAARVGEHWDAVAGLLERRQPRGRAALTGLALAIPGALEDLARAREEDVRRLDAELDAARAAADSLADRVAAQERDLEQIRRSPSWRLTKPLRAIKSAATGRRRT